MKKKITISLSKWVYDEFLLKLTNKSCYIEKAIVKVSEYECSDILKRKQQLSSALSDIRNKDAEILKLKQELGRVKKIIEKDPCKYDPELQMRLKLFDGLRIDNPLREVDDF